MSWFRVSFAAAVILAAGGCQKPVASNIPGTYSAEYENDRDTLEVRPDGTYMHVIGSGPSRQVDEGKWEIDPFPRGDLGVTFEGFRFRAHEGGLKRPGLWIVKVETYALSGKYKLCFDPDLNKCFEKEQ